MSGLSKEMLFVRGNDQDSDALDDSVLLNTYERHFSNVRKKVLLRMGYSNSEVNEVLRPGAKQKKKQQQHQKSPKQPPKWSVGAHCCSVFSEDGNVYEATITELNPEKGTCSVQYVGYHNKEEVEISSLTPSQGRKACEAQILAAAGTEFSNGECSDDCSEDESVQVNMSQQKGKSLKNSRQKRVPQIPPNATEGTPRVPFQPGMGMPRFNGMPPVMPTIVPPMPFNMMEYNAEQAEAFSAMLMSWYMNGYYTGYYEALNARRRKQNNRK